MVMPNQGAWNSSLGRKGLGGGVGFGKFRQECHFLVFCLAASLSQECCLVTRNLSLGQEATEGLHSQESGWPGTSSLAVQTASPGSSTAHPANTRERAQLTWVQEQPHSAIQQDLL